ncbi:unnamed protein product [Lymnaea stagnalis]|uniref:Uncharacterized protein n=1 Tax=Lymnaea stagnalis TaxID=6523 RepID=A0AAV2H8B5_LYMST
MALSQKGRALVPTTMSYAGYGSADRQVGLLTVDDMPELLKEPYIHTGYRPVGLPWTYYLYSTIRLHNETVNVWTHLGGFLLVLVRLLIFFNGGGELSEKTSWPVLGYGVCSLVNLVASTGAHLLHSKSQWHHYVLFLMDYMGVTIFCFGSGIATMYAIATTSYHEIMYVCFLPINVLLSWVAFFTCCLAKLRLTHQHSKRKALMLLGVATQGVFVATPILSRYYQCMQEPDCAYSSLNHLGLVLTLTALCAITFACQIPESLLPGGFDLFGHGHQIFHVLAVMAMLAMIGAMDKDINVMGVSQKLEPNFVHLTLSLAVLVALEVVTLIYCVQRSVIPCVNRDATSDVTPEPPAVVHPCHSCLPAVAERQPSEEDLCEYFQLLFGDAENKKHN